MVWWWEGARSKLSRTAQNATTVREVQARWCIFESTVDCVMKRLCSWCLGFPPQPTTQAEPAAEPLCGAIRRRAIDGSVAAIVGKGARGIGRLVARVRSGAGWRFGWSSLQARSKKSTEHLCGESVASPPVTWPRALGQTARTHIFQRCSLGSGVTYKPRGSRLQQHQSIKSPQHPNLGFIRVPNLQRRICFKQSTRLDLRSAFPETL